MKLARKEFPKYGARIVEDQDGVLAFEMPFGGRFVVSPRTLLPKVRRVLASLRSHHLTLGSGYREAVRASVEGNTVTSTTHFLKRFKEMDVTGKELADVLLRPAHVLRDSKTGRLAFCNDRISVIADVHGHVTLVTLLWASEALWAKHPRKESS